ncbi:MAG: class I poly(R)-hydroxyalkanoic acid synthase, partial [Rhodospirillaceae bacterium]|nr:class I poly(R)-hydroxyalkanoic acid synthase [Rhodospirillaceae bacterium]
MTEPRTDAAPPDMAAAAEQFASIAERSQKIVEDFLASQKEDGLQDPDPLKVGGAFFELTRHMMADPARLWEMQTRFWSDYAELWTDAARRMTGGEAGSTAAGPKIAPEAGDRRFKDAAWTDNAAFEFIKQSYLLASQHIQKSVAETEGLDGHTAHKVEFFTKQWVDAMAPTNFAATNPEVLRATVESKGENLVNGLNNLLTDLERGKGRLAIRMTDDTKFEVGENVAASKGSVVFQNDLMQLIQYAPLTEQAYRTPLLIVPPWINKFYILDLRDSNSFIRWAVSKGHTVFVISWVNPDSRLAGKTFEDYLAEGPLAALDAIERATGEKQLNMIGYCLGGTLTACAMAHLANSGRAGRVKSVTYFTTLVDFENAGDLCVFIDEEQLKGLEQRMAKRGYLEGKEMANTFNMLRANDLIWSFVINNYLLGKDPFPFDLLYWNADATRMPAAMHMFYLRNMYQRNLMVEPGAIDLLGTPIDLGAVETPTFILSTKDDHIAPWKATYSGT